MPIGAGGSGGGAEPPGRARSASQATRSGEVTIYGSGLFLRLVGLVESAANEQLA